MAKLAAVLVVLVIFAVPVAAAWLVARWVFLPRDTFGLRRSVEERDKLINRWAWWRSILGFLTVALVTYRYERAASRYERLHGIEVAFEHHWANVLLEGAIVAGCCILAFAAINHSWRILMRAWRPALRFLLAVALNDLAVGLSKSSELNRIFASGDHSPHAIEVVLVLAGILGFMFASGYYIIRYLYGVSEVNPLLGPVATVAAVSVITVTELHSAGSDGPSAVLLGMTIAGVAGTMYFAHKEWHLLRAAGYDINEASGVATMTIYDARSRKPIGPGTAEWHQAQNNLRAEIGMPVPAQAGQRPLAGQSRPSNGGRIYFAVVTILFGFPTLVTAAYRSPMAFAFGFLFFMFGVVPLLFFLGAKRWHH
jgi:hypothetical protein